MIRLSHTLIAFLFCALTATHSQAQASATGTPPKDHVKSRHAEGTFDVKTPTLAADDATTGTQIARYSIEKQYHGGLDATGKGEMLGAGDPSSGNAGYVAIEQVTGTLNGQKGSFALQHIGSMKEGGFKLLVVVVPGSGSGELAGIGGTLTITVANGKHSYSFDYTLPPPAD